MLRHAKHRMEPNRYERYKLNAHASRNSVGAVTAERSTVATTAIGRTSGAGTAKTSGAISTCIGINAGTCDG